MKRIAILFGGCSSEYPVSLQSAHAIINHVNRDKYEVVLIGITRQGEWFRYDGDYEEIMTDTWHESETFLPSGVAGPRIDLSMEWWKSETISGLRHG
ncbi:MAG: hypothetical protein ACLU8S_07225 [Coprococcus phoceensis]